MTPEELTELAAAQRSRLDGFAYQINVCTATACNSSGSEEIKDRLTAEAKARGIEKRCLIRGVGCRGLCTAGPMVGIEPEGLLYHHVTPDDAPDLLDSLDTQPVERIQAHTDDPFYARQHRIVLEHAGEIDPERLEEYLAVGGYQALAKALYQMTPDGVVEEISRSGLRGRGGAGFPTGLKWRTVAKGSGARKFVICNGDEGDPGAFMDRSVLESDPHRVIEGMAIAAYAVGAHEGYLYVRAEYPLAIKRLTTALRQARQRNLLGDQILGTPFSLNLEIRLGAGAFVCGEETALIASIEGERGQPRPRPPYPAESGLWGFPTLINNVETLANIVPIIRNGGDWFAGIGTEKSKGTKVFALTGQVQNTGLIEVPMGITLREIVFEIGGGVPDGKAFKAVQTGGPSGGCIPDELLDSPVDYESLTRLGSIMGSGGMIVMDETSSMVEVARYFMEFSMTESCGKCIPCRVGTVEMHQLLTRFVEKRATAADLSLLEALCDLTKNTSLCGLGQAAPNPVLSTLRYFRDEYLAALAPDGHGGPAVIPLTVVSSRPVNGAGGRRPTVTSPNVHIRTLTIDGKDVGAREDETILQVARENGIWIPTLCQLDGLSTVGACRLCIVEVKGTSKLLPACVTRVEEGMEVTADSERLREYRKMIIELLFAEGNHICSVCVANGNCDLQWLAQRLGVDHIRFPYLYEKRTVDASHARFGLDHNRCILCTRCVRVCDEVEGAHTWDVQGRGTDCRVITDLAQPWGASESCTSCGKCVSVCPTGALFEKGKAVSEMVKHRDLVTSLLTMRERLR